MDRREIQRLAAASLTPSLYESLSAYGEELLVERKVKVPTPEQLGAEVASMANMLGGWILLGVDDKSHDLKTLDLQQGLDIQSHIGNLLRNAVDPVPPFLAGTLEVSGCTVGYVRVFESSIPVLATGTGTVYTRDAGGKRPIDDHRDLLELAARGRRAEEAAGKRAHENELTRRLLGLAGHGYAAANHLRSVVRAMPFTVTAQFADWPISRAPQDCSSAVAFLVGQMRGDPESEIVVRPYGRAAAARYVSGSSSLQDLEAVAVADCAGIVGAATSQPVVNVMTPAELRRAYIRPCIETAVGLLEQAEAFGDAVLDLNLICSRNVSIKDQTGRFEGHGLPRTIYCGSAVLTIPTDEADREDLAKRWEREVAREVGIPLWESEYD